MAEPVVTAASGMTYTVNELLAVLEDARDYITPTISTHEAISDILGWCDCGYCARHPGVPSVRPDTGEGANDD